MDTKRRRLLAPCCDINKKAYSVDPLCYVCKSSGTICGTRLCDSCGYAILRQCNSCGTLYCNKCQTEDELLQLDPATIALDGDILKIFDASGLATSATIFVDDEPTKIIAINTSAEEPLANRDN